MHVLMLSLIDDQVTPGQDDAAELMDTAGSLREAGVSVTVVMDRRIAENGSIIQGYDERVGVGVSAASGSESHLAGAASSRGSTLELIPIPRLGVIPVRRAVRMPLAVLLQADLAALAEATVRCRSGEPYDLVHCFGWRAGLAAGLLARIINLPLVVSVRDGIADRSPWMADPVEAYSRHVRRWLLERCQAIICPDEYQKEKIIDLFLAGDRRIHVIPSVGDGLSRRGDQDDSDAGCECAGPVTVVSDGTALKSGSPIDIDPTPSSADTDGEKRILYHGIFQPADGLRGLLEAVADINRRSSCAIRLFLAGPGGRPDGPEFGSHIRRLSLADSIAFLESRPESDWWDAVLSAMDLMVLADPVPFVGNLVWKAMARGCPLLAAMEPPLTDWLTRQGLESSIWENNREGKNRYLQRALFDDAFRERLLSAQRYLMKKVQPCGERLAVLYEHICRIGGAENRKGGEHHAVRIAEHGGSGGV